MPAVLTIQPFTDRDGKARYRIRKPENGEILLSSEAYHSHWNRDRAVRRLKKLLGDLVRIQS